MGTAGCWSVFSYLGTEVVTFLVTPGDRVRASLGCLTTGRCGVLGEPISSSVLTGKRKLLLYSLKPPIISWSHLLMLVMVSWARLASGLMACH